MKKLRLKNINLSNLIFNHSLKITFALFLLFATILPLLIGGITSYVISEQTVQEEVSDFNKAWISKQKDYMELLMQEVESLMENIANIDSIKNVLSNETNETDYYTNLSTQATIGYILSGYNLRGLVSIDLISLSGAHYHVGDTLDFKSVDQITKAKLYIDALNSSKSIVWEGLEDNINENSTHQKVITATKLINKIDPETLKEVPIGLLIINYNLDSFYEHFIKSNFNPGSTFIIVDSDRSILFHPDKSLIGSKVDAEFLNNLSGENGAFVKTLNGQQTFIVYSNSTTYGWTVLSYIPMDVLTAKAKPIRNYTFGAALICFLLISLYAWFLSKKVLIPINNMTMLFKEIGDPNADLKRLDVETNNEIGELVKWFNTFMESLAEKKVVEDKLKIAYEELEIRVSERTIELENLNATLNEDIVKRKIVEEKLANRTSEIQETLEKLKATQNQLIEREKLAGIGQLAAGVAHEINNPLGFVSSNISSLENYVNSFAVLIKMYQKLIQMVSNSKDKEITLLINEISIYEAEKSLNYVLDDLEELFADVKEGLERVSKIVKSLRMFSWMDKEMIYEAYDLNGGIENSLLIAKNEIKYYATVEQQLADIPEIVAIGSEVDQVLLNIIVNAAHAIKVKDSDSLGLIKITTANDDNFVYCIIEDNGTGITDENLKNIFNPFFTTKSVGDGTGLGLSVSYDIIVNQHHGEILVNSTMDSGTIFTIKLPIKQDILIGQQIDN